MTTRESLLGLGEVFGVPMADLDDDSIDVIAIRIIAELGDNPTAVEVGKIVDQVRHAERAAGVEPSSVVPAPAALDIPLGQRAMDAAVAVFDEVGQRRGVKRGNCHPACIAGFRDGGTACSDCTWRLCRDDACSHDVCAQERGWMGYFEGSV